MSDVTRILNAIDAGDPSAAAALLPLVYDDLRKLAAARMAVERPGHILDATGLVHEAYLRLVGAANPNAANWQGRGHFFAAAAEAMRRILIDNARRNASLRRGGKRQRVSLADLPAIATNPDDLLAVDDALLLLAVEDAAAAELVKLRLYAGLSVDEAAETLGVSRTQAYRDWTYARAWLRSRLDDSCET